MNGEYQGRHRVCDPWSRHYTHGLSAGDAKPANWDYTVGARCREDALCTAAAGHDGPHVITSVDTVWKVRL